jgi:hypothetical protein
MVTRLSLASTRRPLATNIVTADTFGRRLRGLLGRDRLEAGEAMLFERARQVHTFGMRFALDVVFCDDDWRVLYVVRELRPWRVTKIVRNARYVIELPAGAAAGLAPGEILLAT